MASYDLGTAKGVIEIEYKGDGAKRAREDLNQTGDAASKSGFTMAKAGRAAGVAGLVIAGGFAVATKTAADFEQSMSKVEAVAGATAGEMDALRDKALQLGKDTAFSAGESAMAMEELVKAGLTVDDVLSGAADATVALAAAGSVDMPTAAGIASSAMNSFNIAGKDMAHVADLFAGAANKSATDVIGIGEAFKYVAPMAAATGVSIEDTTTAIAALAKQGISGSQAGTTLRAMLQNLNPASKAAAEEMKNLGIITKDGANQFFDAQGNTKSMAEISGVLAKSMNGLSDEQKSAALSTIFGSRAMTGAIALAKQGEKGFNKLGGAIGEVSAEEVAATKMDNLKGSLEELGGTMETIGIIVGSIIIPALTSLADGVVKALNVFLDLPGGVQKTIVAIIGIIGVSLLALAAFVKITRGLIAVKAAFVAVRAAAIPAWLAALGPIALVVLAIALVAGALYMLWKKSETFRDIVTGVWDAVKGAALAVANWFKGPFVNFFESAWNLIKGGLSAIAGFFTAVWNGIKTAVGAVFSAIGAIISLYINIWKAIISTALAIIGAVWGAFWAVFGGVIKAAFGLVVAIVRLGWTIIKGLFILFLRGILIIVRTVWNAISTAIRAAWGVIKGVVSAGANFIKGIISRVFGVIRAITSSVWNAIRGVIASVWGAIGGTVMGAVNKVKGVISGAWNTVKSLTTAGWNAVKNAVGNAIDGMMNLVTGIKDRVTGVLSGAASWLYDAGKAIIQGLLDGIEAMIGKVTDKIDSVTGAIGKFLPGSPVKEGPLKVLNRGHAGKEIVKMVVGGIGSMEGELNRAIGNMLTVPTPALEDDLGRVHRSGQLSPSPALLGTGEARSRGSSGGGAKGLRLVEGRLQLDKSGRAFIKGVAEEVVMDEQHYRGVERRMGAFA